MSRYPSKYKPITIEDVRAETGLGRDEIKHQIRSGEMPGYVINPESDRPRYVIPRTAFERYINGEWVPTPKPNPTPVVVLHRKAS